MEGQFFRSIFDNLRMPVVVAEKRGDKPVVYMNSEARLLLTPSLSLRKLRNGSNFGTLEGLLRFETPALFSEIDRIVQTHGHIDYLPASIVSYDGRTLEAEICANSVRQAGEEFLVVYLRIIDASAHKEEGVTGELLTRILHEAYHEKGIDETIHSILALSGRRLNVSRVYVFEELDAETTRNTYEWCAEGVDPAIQLLQNLKKADYPYDIIMSNPMFIFNDTRKLSKADRKLLYEVQGIKSIAILPLYHFDKPLGYMGFDDTINFREWSRREIQVLEGVATVISSLIIRRNAEKELRDSREVMQTITDNLDNLIFVTDIDTHELKFVSKSLATAIGTSVENLVGKRCWEVIHFSKKGQCDFCAIPELFDENGQPREEGRVREWYNENFGKWYMVKDNIIKWIDGRPAHLETAIDITYRKQFEEQLRLSASTDAMTTVYNREWGYAKLKEIAAELGKEGAPAKTLCFIDIDDLKAVNDRLGHAAGDEMIVNTIKTISSCIRKEDFMCRWGGDEFLLLLNCDLATAHKVTDKISFALEHFNQSAGKDYVLSVSHGLVEMSGKDTNIDAAIDRADRQMYENKALKKIRRNTTARYRNGRG